MSEFIKDGWISVDHPAVRAWVKEVGSRLSSECISYSTALTDAFEEAEQSKPVELPAAIGSVARSTNGAGVIYVRKAASSWESVSVTGYTARVWDKDIAEAVRVGTIEIIHDNEEGSL